MTDNITLWHGDCLDRMKDIPDGSVDLILSDLPYAITQNSWDNIIPFEPLWDAYRRVTRPGAAIVLTANQPFTSALVMSNVAMYHHCWIWRKSAPTNFLNAKLQPMRDHEDILVFCDGTPDYYPQGVCEFGKRMVESGKNQIGGQHCYGAVNPKSYIHEFTGYPRTVLDVGSEGKIEHPTQKPLSLFAYLIRTYTQPGDMVLDSCMGSGTTPLACLDSGRRCIGIEIDETYFAIANKRVHAATLPLF